MIEISIKVLFAVAVCVLSYYLGCFSSARVIAKCFKKLNVYGVGSGFAINENIYNNISKPLGALAATLDATQIFLFILLIKCKFTYIEL